jgi:hypothetical protein
MRVEAGGADRAIAKDKARGFLWQHWSEKKCGELFLTEWSREGVRTDSHYKIPVWHLAAYAVALSSP